MAGVLRRFLHSSPCCHSKRKLLFLLQPQEYSLQQVLSYSTTTADNKSKKLTSIGAQYQAIKDKYPDFIVLFQIGEFFEMYSKDAIKVANKTSLRVSRNPIMHQVMAGFPVRSLDSWLLTLVKQGFQVAVCPQISEKKSGKSKLFHRDVTRLVTPGTLFEPLQPDANYLLSITRGHGTSVGMAWLDISTGDFHMGTSSFEELDQDIARVNPAEILMTDDEFKESRGEVDYKPSENRKNTRKFSFLQNYHITSVSSDWFQTESTENLITKTGMTNTNTQFSVLEMCAGEGLLKYVQYTQKDITPLVSHPLRYNNDRYMTIDLNTRRSLELTKSMCNNEKASLFGVVNKTSTSAGKRLLFQRICAPSTEMKVVQQRLDTVECFYNNINITESIQKTLKKCTDLERRLQKVATGGAELGDLRSIHQTFTLYSLILTLVDSMVDNTVVVSNLVLHDFNDLDDLQNELQKAVGKPTARNRVMEGYSSDADDIREKIRQNEQSVVELRDQYREDLGIPRLTISPHRLFIRVVELPVTQADKVDSREDFVKIEKTAEKVRYSTLKLTELNADYKHLDEEDARVQKDCSEELCNQVTQRGEHIKRLAKSLAELDVASSLALVAIRHGYNKPVIVEDPAFDVKGGRHPVIDVLQTGSFVTNDCNLTEQNLWIVTGPNMGGKSTFLRQNALISILAQSGSFVPAQQAVLGIVDRVFARIGSSDNLVQHESTFMTEMLETAYILSHATTKSFVVLDEIGRGTSMVDGLAIAWAVIEHVHDVIQCRTLAATHFHQLGELSFQLQRVENCHVTAEHSPHGIVFNFRVKSGVDTKSFGIDVAKLAGIPMAVESRARELLDPMEKRINFITKGILEEKSLSS